MGVAPRFRLRASRTSPTTEHRLRFRLFASSPP